MAKLEVSRKLLERVGTQMNDVMGLNPPIDVNMADDDTLLDTLRWEATGRGKISDAIRADDFVSDNPGKKLFAADVHKFFVDSGVWDDKKQVAVIGKKTEPKAAAQAAAPAESEEQPEVQDVEERLEVELEAQLDAKGQSAETPAPQKAARKKAGKAAPAAPAGQAPEAKKEDTMKSAARGAVSRKTAVAKKRAAKGTATQKKAAVKEKKEAVLSCFGHRDGSSGALMDEALNSGKTLAAVAKAAGIDEKRVRGHIQHLRADHSIQVHFDDTGKAVVKKIKK